MSLTRTRSGLLNENLLWKTDSVVYIEGGESLAVKDVLDGKYNRSSRDLPFWETIFDVFAPSIKVKFKPVGSKATLRGVAELVNGDESGSVVVAVDRDFDDVVGLPIQGSFVILTHGYSWENDVWQRDVISSVLFSLTPMTFNRKAQESDIARCLRELAANSEELVRVGIALHASGLAWDAIDSPEKFIMCPKNSFPMLNSGQVQRYVVKRRADCRKEALELARYRKVEPLSDLRGHFVATFCYRIVVGACARLGSRERSPKSAVNALAIEKLRQLWSKGKYRRLGSHYRRQLHRAIPKLREG